ncbi:hypothetical protein ACHAXR_006718 [Thalassiosira sp. AJA248-18]
MGLIFGKSGLGDFGGGHDFSVVGCNLSLNIGNSYEPTPRVYFRQYHGQCGACWRPISFAKCMNDALNSKLKALKEAEEEISHLESRFEDEESFTNAFACGDVKDVVRQ